MSEEQNDPFNPYRTPCRQCVFADFREKTQVGCKLNRLERFQEQDPNCIVPAEDGDLEFFVVNGRLCNAYRNVNSRWAGEHQADSLVAIVDELKVRLSVIVMLKGKTEEQITATAQSLLDQKLQPNQVLFVSEPGGVKAARLHALLFTLIGNKLTWRIQNVLKEMSREKVVDEAVGAVTSPFYSIFDAGYVIPPSFIDDVNQSLNYRLERWSLLRPFSGQGLTIQTKYAQTIGGHSNPLIVEHEGQKTEYPDIVSKLTHYAASEDKPYLVKNVEEVCPSLV